MFVLGIILNKPEGQSPASHERPTVSVPLPDPEGHLLPVQVCVRSWRPMPHVTSHCDQGVHGDSVPPSGPINNNLFLQIASSSKMV